MALRMVVSQDCSVDPCHNIPIFTPFWVDWALWLVNCVSEKTSNVNAIFIAFIITLNTVIFFWCRWDCTFWCRVCLFFTSTKWLQYVFVLNWYMIALTFSIFFRVFLLIQLISIISFITWLTDCFGSEKYAERWYENFNSISYSVLFFFHNSVCRILIHC